MELSRGGQTRALVYGRDSCAPPRGSARRDPRPAEESNTLCKKEYLVESMLKQYKVPVLLIEFHPDKAFCLIGSGDITPDIKLTSIISQLALLTIHFPQLRVLWSKSEHATADMFKELMKNNAPVDVAKAQAAGGEEGGEGMGDDASATAKDLLLRLPGVNVHNFRNVLREVDTIADLSDLSEEQLRPMLGAGNAKKLHKFFRQPAPL